MIGDIQTLTEIIQSSPELRVRGQWCCINIETSMAWPIRTQSFLFEGHQIWVMPYTSDTYPGLAMLNPPGIDRHESWAVLHRALSLICWMNNGGAIVVHINGGNLPRMVGTKGISGRILRDTFDLTDLTPIPSERAGLALALMREGGGLNHPAYAFLSYFRVVETALAGRERKAWVEEKLQNIGDHRAHQVLSALQSAGIKDVSKHLYNSGRMAIAHAGGNPVINPDNPEDSLRIGSELPLMRQLAVLAIEEVHGVKTSSTIYREHLYELLGWKRIFGNELIAVFMSGEKENLPKKVSLPRISVRLRKSDAFPPFENMQPASIALNKAGLVELAYRNDDGLVEIRFQLDFDNERLIFDIHDGVFGHDDGSAAAADHQASMKRFFRDYYLNGELQVWNAESNELMSRKDGFIPENVMLDVERCNELIDNWIAEAEKRRTKSG